MKKTIKELTHELECCKETIVIYKESIETLRDDRHRINKDNKELREQLNNFVERERVFMINLIAQNFQSEQKFILQDGVEQYKTVTPELDKVHQDMMKYNRY